MRIGAVITARSSSSRYPRKHLGQLGDRTMIEQIIRKLKKLRGIDFIILSTTDQPSDDDLVEVAHSAGADINRGSEKDLLSRDFQAIERFNLDAVLSMSGDCPFISNEFSQMLIDALTNCKNPEDYDSVAGIEVLAPIMEGFATGIQLKSAYEKYEMLMNKYPGKYSYEQYWVSVKEEPEIMKPLIVDTSKIIEPTITPMKMSIDWNLERLFWCKVIDWLGYFPETIKDFNKAFGGMTEL